MIHRLCLTIALLLAPAALCAGAWPRAEGTAFLSVGAGQLSPETGGTQSEATLYAEWGLSRDYTLGFSGSANMDSRSEGHVFLRFPPYRWDGGALAALELGYGAKSTDGTAFSQFVKISGSWSKGITLWDRSGWLSVDLSFFKDTDASDDRVKLDTTLGLSVSERFSVIGQVFAEQTQFGESLTLVPSLVYNTQGGRVRYQIGYEHKSGEDAQTALRLNIWTEF
jgi:hypothetical protein